MVDVTADVIVDVIVDIGSLANTTRLLSVAVGVAVGMEVGNEIGDGVEVGSTASWIEVGVGEEVTVDVLAGLLVAIDICTVLKDVIVTVDINIGSVDRAGAAPAGNFHL
ncbi:MAG: hypothetical protein R2911_29225 [Caldilineaceae bacterium]